MESKENLNNFENIKNEILEMVRIDQEMRRTNTGDNFDDKLFKKIDSENTGKLKEIIKQIGWPNKTKVGDEASKGAWLIAQHADLDIEFQKSCYELMKSEPENEVSEIDIAYLYDRICVNEGRPQFFGTQFYDNEFGAYGPRPIQDIETVDERRKSIGLDTLEEYKKRLEKKYK